MVSRRVDAIATVRPCRLVVDSFISEYRSARTLWRRSVPLYRLQEFRASHGPELRLSPSAFDILARSIALKVNSA